MRNRYDYVAKQIGQRALCPSGATFEDAVITPEPQQADLRHEPDPAHQAERDRLGLLGRIAAEPCLIESYSKAPDAAAFRACLAKHLVSWQQRVRAARRNRVPSSDRDQPPHAPGRPILWIIAAGAPTTLLTQLALAPAPDWPTGIYFFGAKILRVGIIVASQLPRDRSTLLVRVMAGGPLLSQATTEVLALPPDAHERVVAEPVLLSFRRIAGKIPDPHPDVKEFIMVIDKSLEQVRAEGRIETQARAVLTVLRVRGIAVSDAVRDRILAQKDLEQLYRWHEKAVVASSLGEVLDEPS